MGCYVYYLCLCLTWINDWSFIYKYIYILFILVCVKNLYELTFCGLQIFDFKLSPEDMKTIDGINRNVRYVDLSMYVSIWNVYKFFVY